MNGLGRKKEETEKKQSVKESVFTKETLGVVLVLFATLCLVCLITRDKVFSVPGQAVNAFLFGCFGYFAYAIVAVVAVIGLKLIADKKFKAKGKPQILFYAMILSGAVLAHAITMNGYSTLSYGDYLVKSYQMASGGIATSSAGGIVTGVVAYWATYLLSDVGTYVVCSILVALFGYMLVTNMGKASKKNEEVEAPVITQQQNQVQGTAIPEVSGEKDYPIQGVFAVTQTNQPTQTETPYSTEQSTDIRFNFDNAHANYYNNSYSDMRDRELQEKLDYILRPVSYEENKRNEEQIGTRVSDYVTPMEEHNETIVETPPLFEHTEEVAEIVDDATTRANEFSERYVNSFQEEVSEEVKQTEEDEESVVFPPENEQNLSFDEGEIEIEEFEPTQPESENRFGFGSRISERRQENSLLEEPKITEEPFIQEEKPQPEKPADTFTERFSRSRLGDRNSEERANRTLFGESQTGKKFDSPIMGYTSRVEADKNTTAQAPIEEKPKKPAPPINRKYNRPPLDLLETHIPPLGAPQEDHASRMAIIKQTLEEFRISVEPQSFIQGPTITRYEIKMPAGVSVKKVLGYDDDLKMYLESKTGIRIEAPIPGKNLVGIEVANKTKVTVGLRELMENMASKPSKSNTLMFAIGKDIVGNTITDNLAKGPHYLVAGATGSGKSVCLNVMITSLIMRYSPEELRLVLVDPKSVGFRIYEHIPHLLIDEIITDVPRTLAMLQWAYNEMERRYKVFADCGAISDIDDYNSQIANAQIPKLPRIVIVIDELADLMETNKKEMESRIRALAQKSRAAGIHLVLATQRPSVDIITGTIKANLPSRIALRVMNFNDSQTILGEAGAEKLLGNGDMLYKNSSMSECERYQGAWLSNSEISNIVSYIKENNAAYFEDEVTEYLDKAVRPKQEETEVSAEEGDENALDDLFVKALWFGIVTGEMSISKLQRRFQIGYARAGGLVDKMERLGFISGNEGSKARKVLIDRQQFEDRFGPMSEA